MKIDKIKKRKEPPENTVEKLEMANVDLLDVDRDKVRFLDIDPVTSYKYAGDFFALLLELNIDENLFQRLLALNGMDSPAQWKGNRNYISYIET